MSEHLSAEEMMRYRTLQSPMEEITRIQDHADECDECRTRLASGADAAALRAVFTAEPDEQELVRFVARQLPEGRAAEIANHVETCERCAAVVRDLGEFAAGRTVAEIAVRRAKPARWLALAAAVLAGAGISFWIAQERGPKTVAFLQDAGGRQVALLESGRVTGIADGSDAEETGWLRDALRDGKLPGPADVWQTPNAGVLRGSGDAAKFHLLEPVGKRTLETEPEFRWEVLAGAKSYQVTVFTEDERVVAQSGDLTEPSWRPNVELPRGQKLAWQVTARRGEEALTEPAPPQPRAYFEVVAASDAARIEAARTQNAPSHLVLAVLYARAGLKGEAEKEIMLLEQINPRSAAVARLRDGLR